MSLVNIRTEIKTILSAVDGIGVVHDYVRWANEWSKFLDLFKDSNNKVNGWMISRISTPSKRDNMSTLKRRHLFRMEGFYGLQDSSATEIVFQGVVEDIQDAFDSQYSLGGHALNSGPVQVIIIENRVFGKVLCHYARLEYEVEERKTYN